MQVGRRNPFTDRFTYAIGRPLKNQNVLRLRWTKYIFYINYIIINHFGVNIVRNYIIFEFFQLNRFISEIRDIKIFLLWKFIFYVLSILKCYIFE